MFLFTTPSSPTESPAPAAPARPALGAAGGPVVQGIREGASASGVGFDYLLATARRESALDPSAKAATSSATGLFQFIEQTWLGVMKSAGPRLGLQSQADAITRQADGTYAVPDAARRQEILELRRDPKVSATLAGALTQQNGEALAAALGREPTAGDLYAAHVLGARGAAALIGTARTFPERAAALDLPEAAAANRALFYDRTGRPRTAAELYASLAAAAQGAAATDLTPLRQEGATPPQAAIAYAATATGPATAAAFGGGSDLRSLFQTDRRAAAPDALARLFQGRAAGTPPRAAPSYFPRSGPEPDLAEPDRAQPAPVAPAAASSSGAPVPGEPAATGALPTPAGRALVNPPLPPRRPAEFAAAPANSLFTLRSSP